MIGIRYHSETNPWIDFVVFTDKEDKENVKCTILRGMDKFWENGDACYGDVIMEELRHVEINKGNINPFVVFIDQTLPESMWEDYLRFVDKKYGLEVL